MSEPTVDSIRDELRQAIFWTQFQAGGYEMQGQKEQHHVMQQGACAFVEFGTRTNLLTPEEGNDWLDAIWGRQVPAKVLLKYVKETADE